MRDADQVSPCDPVERVTGRADFPVHLVAPTDGGVVKRIERALVRPRVGGRVEAVFGGGVGGCLGDEGEGAVQVGVVGDGAGREGGGTDEGGSG